MNFGKKRIGRKRGGIQSLSPFLIWLYLIIHLIVAHVQHFNVRASGQSIPMQIYNVLKVGGNAVF
jgi:hypothetical protein